MKAPTVKQGRPQVKLSRAVLHAAADAARERVSGYGDDRRSELENQARSLMQRVKSSVCCS
jgi:hypothetical protein